MEPTTAEPDIARQVIEQTDDVVRDTVRSLMAVKRLNIARLAPLLSMNEETLRRKLNSWGSQRAFSGGEIYRLAQVFDVPFGDMASGRFLPIGVDRDLSHSSHAAVTRPYQRWGRAARSERPAGRLVNSTAGRILAAVA